MQLANFTPGMKAQKCIKKITYIYYLFLNFQVIELKNKLELTRVLRVLGTTPNFVYETPIRCVVLIAAEKRLHFDGNMNLDL